MPSKNKQVTKNYYENNKEHLKAYGKEYRKNKNITQTEYTYSRYRDKYEFYVLKRSQHNASKRGLEFNITIEDIVIPELCPYLGCKITRIMGQGRIMTNASLDRIDNSKGYIKGNVRIISYQANIMKQDVTEEQLIAFAKGVLQVHNAA